jgi:N-acetylmuramoyl-L-alanine amidase
LILLILSTLRSIQPVTISLVIRNLGNTTGEPQILTFPRHLTLFLLASASIAPLAQEKPTQQPAPAKTPAPGVRSAPKPTPKPAAPSSGTPAKILTHSYAVPSSAKPKTAAPSAATPPKPAPKPVAPASSPAQARPVPVATPSTTKPATPPKPQSSAASTAAALGQLSASAFNRTIVVLDPAHGGGDSGSRINDQLVEKDITLAFAFRLRSLLTARAFTVVMTRDNDDPAAPPSDPPSLDDRAGIADHARPVACLLIHATPSGSGVHLYTSELDAAAAEPVPAPWLTAQAAWVNQSQLLATQIGNALGRAKIPLVTSRASVRPVDSLTCPALVVELAPSGSNSGTLSDTAYQQHIAEAIAGALVVWQNQAQPPIRLAPPAPVAPVSEVQP